jgi:flagellar biosynthesis protein FlhF
VPLESFIGPAVDALLVRACEALGADAEIIAVRTVRTADGGTAYQVLAGDAESAADERRRMAPDGGSHPLLKSSPGPDDFARTREQDTAPRVIAFVGPTGVGKTTTIAKLATHAEFFRGQRIGMLCLDTYRVGAVEQIRTYAEIAGLPCEVIYEASDLPAALRRLADRDLIFVDTPGRGPRLQADTAQVRQWLSQLAPHETHLALPSGLQPILVRRTIEAFRPHGVTHLLATKLDEAPDDWTLFDIAAELRLPMRWLSDGQEVPRDLKSAAPRLLASVAAIRVTASTPTELLA